MLISNSVNIFVIMLVCMFCKAQRALSDWLIGQYRTLEPHLAEDARTDGEQVTGTSIQVAVLRRAILTAACTLRASNALAPREVLRFLLLLLSSLEFRVTPPFTFLLTFLSHFC